MAATLMLANGEHPEIALGRLGHPEIRMTLNVRPFGHALPVAM